MNNTNTKLLCDECCKILNINYDLYLGVFGKHKCDKCNKIIDCNKEKYCVIYSLESLIKQVDYCH